MSAFDREYKRLNPRQKEAVDTIEGPVLVIAGPGTGKTQLLSARVARILDQTDTPAQNILCLTFTENGAQNMRERLTRFISQDAHRVTVSTYHAFGGDLIRNYPEYFSQTRLQNPVDELGKYQILAEIIEKMSYLNPLKQTRWHLGDLISTISEVKRALLTSDDLRAIAAENAQFISQANKIVSKALQGFIAMPRSTEKALANFTNILEGINPLLPAKPARNQLGTLAEAAITTLSAALDETTASNKTAPLTKWKNDWLGKNSDNRFTFNGELVNKRVEALADVLDNYQAVLDRKGLYDFDDMIVRSIKALEQNNDLKYTLQEKYLYVLLDEFQDTNAAQLRMVQLLSDNPVHEDRPNVMAVGDDDQAIYSFQGAQYSNMLDFYNSYRDVKVINLTENYRSHADILQTAHKIAHQIESRLHHNFGGATKILTAMSETLPKTSQVTRNEFQSDIAQYSWMAGQIKKMIDEGTKPSEIAVLAPKHKHLEPLVPYLRALGIPARYEKRENILETPVVRQLLAMSRLVLALKNQNEDAEAALWPEVLSFDFWDTPTSKIWKLAWQVNDEREKKATWSKVLLKDEATREPALMFLSLALITGNETCETMLDYLVGSSKVETREKDLPVLKSPLRDFYTSRSVQKQNPELFYETLSYLKILRTRLREYQATTDSVLKLDDLITFVEMYEAADQRMLNTSPYNEQADAVQIMTVFKAKGLEFEHVFLPCCQDDVWGGASRGNSNRLTLPPNLTPIRHAGTTDDERLRILFVALTRAKFGLHLCSFSNTYAGKATKRLKYFNEQADDDGSFRSLVLPDRRQAVLANDHEAPLLEQLEIDWKTRHFQGTTKAALKNLLETRLSRYKLSPTHLNTFIDMEYGGPEKFFFHTLLRFPQAPTTDSQYGNAVHETLEWVQHQVNASGKVPSTSKALAYFQTIMRAKKLTPEQTKLEIERGQKALTEYLKVRGNIFKKGDRAEHNFRSEGVLIGEVRMGGKIDRMEIDQKAKTITVVDYKTGKSYEKWSSIAKLHKYRQQLYCYKLLVENSPAFEGHKVVKGRLEFVEPDENGKVCALELSYDLKELERVKRLLNAMWYRVMNLDFPDTNSYSKTLKGIREFEEFLLGPAD
jgi:DNA helicase-2/ATP-dependent DNA helicase PcrA